MEAITGWFSDGTDWAPQVLGNDRLSLAVARGAAYFGMVRRGEGVAISAKLARTYYVGIEGDPPQAVCLVPARAATGEDIAHTGHTFQLLVDQPVEFPLFVSSTRLTDEPGDVVPIDLEQMHSLPPIRTVLQMSQSKKREAEKDRTAANVQLHARLTEIGTVQLSCREVEGSRQWRLEFDVRSATQTDLQTHAGVAETRGIVDEDVTSTARDVISGVFSPEGKGKPAGLVKQLGRALDTSRWDWSPSLLRRIWDILMEYEPGRRKSPDHEARWLNLIGFSLRPGFGLALDDWRVDQTWNAVHSKLIHSSPMIRTEYWILWRRIAGGFSARHQWVIATPMISQVRGLHRRMTSGGRGGKHDFQFGPAESIEIWRLLGSLELLPVAVKIELAEMLLDLVPKRKMENARDALVGTLGRLGTRSPLYGPLNVVVPAETVAEWIAKLMEQHQGESVDTFAVMQMARRTGDRYRDIDEPLRGEVLQWLTDNEAAEHHVELVRAGGRLDEEEQGRILGESLPKGLRIVAS